MTTYKLTITCGEASVVRKEIKSGLCAEAIKRHYDMYEEIFKCELETVDIDNTLHNLKSFLEAVKDNRLSNKDLKVWVRAKQKEFLNLLETIDDK